MKKTFLLIGCLALLVAGCSREKDVLVPNENPQDGPERHLIVNITVNQEDPDTRVVKTAWEAGDKVYFAFDGYFGDENTKKAYYLTLTYDGENWNSAFSDQALETYLLGPTGGRMAAAYTSAGFPNGEEPQFEYDPSGHRIVVTNETPGFTQGVGDAYYEVNKDDLDRSVLTATVNMKLVPIEMVHFFIEGVSEADAERYSFESVDFMPVSFGGFDRGRDSYYDWVFVRPYVNFDGTKYGAPIPADYYSNGEVSGVRFCGALHPSLNGVSHHFVLQVTDNRGTPDNANDDIIYTLEKDATLAYRKSVKLPELGPDSKWEMIELGSAITFESDIVKDIAVYMWDTSGDGELSYAEAAAVTELGRAFSAYSSGVIPDELKQRLVAENAPFSFNELQYFTGLTGIEESAFMGTKNLNAIKFPPSITSIGDYAFSGCGLYANSDETIVIPEGVKRIGERAFEANPFFKFNLPASVTEIYGNTFLHCPMLSQINVSSDNPVYENPLGRNSIVEKSTQTLIVGGRQTDIVDGVKKIGPYAFCGREFNWTVLENNEMVFPDSVEEIGKGAFYHCLGLKSIKLGSGLKSIGDMAFEACVELGYFPSNPKPLVIPGNVESIGSEAFSSCDIMLLTLENGVKTIGEQAFFSCDQLRTVEIPSSVESIGKEAFYCEGFESIADLAETPQPYAEEMLGSVDKTFPIRVPDASVAAYKQAWPVYANRIVGLVNIQFESELVKRIAVTNWDTSGDGELSYAEAAAVTDLGEVFKGIHDSFTFDELKYFTGLESIGENAFSESYGLEHIELPSSIKSIGKSAFNFCYSLTHIELPSSIESIGWGAFANCVDIKQISIPEGVTEIGDFAFAGLSLDSFHLPASVNVFDGSSIAYCNLSEVTVAAGNTTFYSPSGSNAIMYRSAPTLVVGCSTIPEGTLVIGPYAFSGRNITSIKIPATVFVIGEGAFYACEKLESVYDFATTPQTPLNQMLDVYSKTFPIYVPIGSVDAYKTAWPNYADRIKPMDLDASFEKFNDEKEW